MSGEKPRQALASAAMEPSSDTRRVGDRELADRLHSAAIHLLRRLRVEDPASGLSAPRLSALSVLVFGGPLPLTALAEAEQVRPPTMSRLVKELEAEGLVERRADPADRRVQRVKATAKGRRLLREGRDRRVRRLARSLAELTETERRALARALPLLERLALPPEHPRQESRDDGDDPPPR